jgi:hypothetical protein
MIGYLNKQHVNVLNVHVQVLKNIFLAKLFNIVVLSCDIC